MPATSLKQKRLMDAAAHNSSFARQVGIPQAVAQDFSQSSKGLKFGRGSESREDLQGINKPKTDHGKMSLMKKGGTMKHELHKHHMEMAHHHLKEAMKHGGHVKKMASGGMTTGMHGIDEKRGMTTAKMGKVKEGGMRAHGEHAVQERGHTRALQEKMKGNTIGDGPLYNVKGPAMKRGGKTHHKK
jgi:hypothetical protein